MDSRALAAFLSSLISELLLLLFLLFPSSNPLSLTSTSTPNSLETIFPLLHQFLSISHLSLLPLSKKRKRTHHRDPDSDSYSDPKPGSRFEPGPTQNPDSLKLSFKMSSSTFEWLAGLLEPLLECRDPVESPLNLSAEVRLGIGLFRLATGSDYPEISDRFGVSEYVARFCVKQLCRVLCTNFRFWVGFPSPNELESVSTGFENLTGLPNCCGVIECTRFKVVRDGACELLGQEESIAAQVVVDSSSRILSIVVGFRGDKSDWKVLKCSTLYKDVEGQRLLDSPPVCVGQVGVNQYLVGGGGYPLLPWLMVPFDEPMPGSSEENFNAVVHGLMRVSGFRTVASLKTWGVLSRPIEGEFKTAVAYIGACSILHNVLLMRDDDSGLFDGLGDCSLRDQGAECEGDIGSEENSIESKASAMRSALATRAKQICSSSFPMNPSGSVELQSN